MWLMEHFPSFLNSITEWKLNFRFDHEMYGLKPAHRFFSAHPTVNDDLPNRIACAGVVIKPNVKHFTPTGVVFEDGSEVEIDTAIICTGYSFGFPYLEEGGLIPVKDNECSLYKWMFPTNLPHHTLAVIGLIQPLGAIMPISEMQCRVFCETLVCASTLPGKSAMEEDVRLKKRDMSERYVSSRRHTIQVDYGEYMDELAELIGARPQVLSTLFAGDPALARALFLGPLAPYQYRLTGPHTWPEARKNIMTMWDRVLYPTQRPSRSPQSNSESSARKLAMIFVIVCICYLLYSCLF